MTTQKVKRKLAAILSADAKGYSRLMGEDEVGTIRTLNAYKEVMTSLIQQHRGGVVDAPADNVLAEFGSVVDAVQCAVEIQKELKTRNAELPENRRIEFRIGVNLGDVVEDGEQILGDGVNIAARLESLSEAGGICISGTAFDQVRNKLGLGYDYLGEQSVKNIALPIRVYKVLMEPEAAGKVIGEKKSKPRRWHRAPLIVMAILIVMVTGAAIWKLYVRPTRPIEVAYKEKMAFPLPDKPSIAVLPFANMSDDPEQEYFSDGLTEEIISALSKVPKLFVIARNSSFTYKGKPVKVQQVSEELGVQFVLEGSVRKAGNHIRITTQLIDATTGYHVWSQRYDRDMKDIFVLQDEITMEIIAALQMELTEGEQARMLAKRTENLQAYLKFLKGREIFLRVTKEDNAFARQIFEEVIALDPEYAPAYTTLGVTHWMDVFFGSSKSPKESLSKAMKLIQKSIALDDSFATAYTQLGWLYTLAGQHEAAIAEMERAIALAPNDSLALIWMGYALRFAGRHEEGVRFSEQAVRLNPIPPSYYFRNLAACYIFTGRYDEAIGMCKKGLIGAPNDIFTHLTLTAAFSQAGREDAARAQAKEVLRINPKFTLEDYSKRLNYKNQTDRDFFIEALRKAGLK